MSLKKLIILRLLFLFILMIPLAYYFLYGTRPLVPAWQWQAKAVTSSGKKVSAQVWKFYGQDMPLHVRVSGNNRSAPLYSKHYYSSEGCVGPPHRWFKVFISTNETWMAKHDSPWYLPYPHANLYPDYDYGNEFVECHGLYDNNRWSLQRNGDESIQFSSSQITIYISKRSRNEK